MGSLSPIVLNKVITFVDPDGSEGPASAFGTYVPCGPERDGRVDYGDYNLIWPSDQIRGAVEPGKFAP